MPIRYKIPYIDLNNYTLDPDTVSLISEELAKRLGIIALEEHRIGNLKILVVGKVDLDFSMVLKTRDSLSDMLGYSVKLIQVEKPALLTAFDRFYNSKEGGANKMRRQ